MTDAADSCPKLCMRMRLWEFPDQYVIEPIDGSVRSFLAISRVDGSINSIDALPECSSLRVPRIWTIFGVIGMLKLFAGSYLFVIMERECTGSYLGNPIFKISSLKVFPCNQSLKNSPVDQQKMETEFAELLNLAEKAPGLYFSYDANLTLNAQRLNDLGHESKLLPLWRQADPRFLWNNYMMEVLIDNKMDQYLLPIVQGSFQNFQAAIGKDIIDVTLIARRCTRRSGTRMWRRGADADGYVANFVESEQIVQLHGFTASFVQVRGSIPLVWEQVVDLSYKPDFEILKPEEAPRVIERHFLDLRKKYGAVLAVDLINKHGGEGRLCEKFAGAMQHVVSDDIRYLHFDFHHICGHLHFHRLSVLYEQISDFLSKNGYLLLNDKGDKISEQLGVTRTNCVDCLDRTNVTQSMIGRKMMESQLRKVGLFGPEETIDQHPNFDDYFKILWANHGDEISIQYSGTPALKGDFVRYGKRTVQGILNDGRNALLRYYLNNFCDGRKQDAIDLLQGHFIISVDRSMGPVARKPYIQALVSLPALLVLVLTGSVFATLSLKQGPLSLWSVVSSGMWAGMSIGAAAFVTANGRSFCDRPRLHST